MAGTEDRLSLYVQRLVKSPRIKHVCLLRGATGEACTVVLGNDWIQVNGKQTDLPGTFNGAQVLSFSAVEDLLLLTFGTTIVLLRIFPDGTVPWVVDSMKPGMFLWRDDWSDVIAVDPLGRCIAVQVSDYVLQLSCLRSTSSSVVVTNRQRLDLADSVILHVTFLELLKGGNADHVVFAVVYAHQGRVKIVAYEWWDKDPSSRLAKLSTLPLQLDDSDPPLFIVPVRSGSGVVVATSSRLIFLTLSHIMSGILDFASCEIPSTPLSFFKDPHEGSGSSQVSDSDKFYLSTVSRAIYTVHLTQSEISVTLLTDLECDLGSALTIQPYDASQGILNCPVSDADSIIVTYGGDMTEGGCVIVDLTEDDDKASQSSLSESVSVLDTYPSWAPISDFETISVKTKIGRDVEMYACTGMNESGALTQFSHGIHGTVLLSGLPLSDVSALFSVRRSDGAVSYLVVSLPWKTLVYQTVNEDGELQFKQIGEDRGIKCDAETLAVHYIPDSNLLLQITRSDIILTDLQGATLHKSLSGITGAAACGHFVALSRLDSETGVHTLSAYSVATGEEGSSWISQVGKAVPYQAAISVVKLYVDGDRATCLVGSYEPGLKAYTLSTSGLEESFDLREVLLQDEVPNSLVLLPKDGETERYIVGLRNGWYVHVSRVSGNLSICSRQLADLPIELIDGIDGSTLALHGRLSHVPCTATDMPCRVVIDTERKQPVVRAACRFEVDATVEVDADRMLLAVIVSNQLQVLILDKTPSTIPRHIHLGATPRRLIYLEHVSAFAVVLVSNDATAPNHLTFVDPHSAWPLPGAGFHLKHQRPDKEESEPIFSPSERVVVICEWAPVIDGKQYRFLVVGSGHDGQGSGTLRLLRVSRDSTGIRVTVQYSMSRPDPVQAICPFDNTTLFYGTQGQSKIQSVRLSTEDGRSFKFEEGVAQDLESPLVSISIRDNYVYALTLINSVVVFKYNGRQLEAVGADGHARAALSLLHIVPNETEDSTKLQELTMLVSDKSQTVSLLRVPTTPNVLALARHDASVSLASITRMRTVNLKTTWTPTTHDVYPPVLATGIGGDIYVLRVLSPEQKMLFTRPAPSAPPTKGVPIYPGLAFRQRSGNARSWVSAEDIVAELHDEGVTDSQIDEFVNSTSLTPW